MKMRFSKVAISAILVFALMGIGFALTGCGSSDKDKALEIADQLEAMIDKYSARIQEKKEAGDREGLGEVMQEFQKESMAIMKELEGLKGNLSDKEEKEVEKRFEEIGKKLFGMMKM